MPEGPGRTSDDNGNDGTEDGPSPLGAAAPVTIGRESRPPRSRGDRRSLRRTGTIALAVVGALVLLALTPTVASGLMKTPRDRVGISYGGGPFEGTHFQRVVQPGSSLFFNGFFDPLYLYPADQVNYIVSTQRGVGAQPGRDSVIAPTRDRVQVEYEVATYFKLNTNLLQTFHEQLGLRYRAYTTDGWNALLRDTFRQQIENALQEETRRVDVADLFGDADLLVELQDRVQSTLSGRLEAALGRRFFCSPTFVRGGDCGDPTFVIKSVDIPDSVVKAFQDNRTSAIQVLTKSNEVEQREAEARAIAALGLSGDEYVLLKAIEAGKVNFWVLPTESGITLTAPRTPGASPSTTVPGAG